MDVHAARASERMLRRVMALLFASAVLAERVSHRSAPIRWFVLWLLRRAETAAADFVFEEAGIPPVALEGLDGIAAVGNGPEDALRLAARFRALADALRALLPDAYTLVGRRARSGRARGDGPRPAPLAGHWTPIPYDTS